MLRDRPRIRPGTKEQLDEPVVEYIEKSRKGLIPREQVVIGLLGDRERQRTLRSKQAEEFDNTLNCWLSPLSTRARLEAGNAT